VRYEAMRLLQFLFSLTLIVGAFAAGVLAGWYRWAPRRTSDTRDDAPATDVPSPSSGLEASGGPLFSPDAAGWGSSPTTGGATPGTVLTSHTRARAAAPVARGELPRASVPPPENVIDLRSHQSGSSSLPYPPPTEETPRT
jgi:hypothetical protein